MGHLLAQGGPPQLHPLGVDLQVAVVQLAAVESARRCKLREADEQGGLSQAAVEAVRTGQRLL